MLLFGSSVWIGGADVSLLDFCSIAFYKQPLLRRGCLAGFAVVFLFTQPPAHGAREAHAPSPVMMGSVFGLASVQ